AWEAGRTTPTATTAFSCGRRYGVGPTSSSTGTTDPTPRSARITNYRHGRPRSHRPRAAPIRDFGAGAGAVADRTDLAEILTMVIWTAGPQHAAVNFPQEEPLSYLPANPIAGFTEEPRGRDHTLQDWLAHLPPVHTAVHQLSRRNVLVHAV